MAVFWAAALKGAMSYRIGRFVRPSVLLSIHPYVRLFVPPPPSKASEALREASGVPGQASQAPSQALGAIRQAAEKPTGKDFLY